MGTSGVDVVRLLGSDIFSRGKPSENCEGRQVYLGKPFLKSFF